jgi:hypothetical protein
MIWYIATVWMREDAYDAVETRRVIRLRATDPDDFRQAVAQLWPRKVLTFGPIGKSKDQT